MAKIQLKPSLSARRTPVETKTTGKKPAPVVKKSDIPGLTLSQIRKATPKYILNNSNEVVISSLKQKATKTGLPGVIAKPVSVGMKGRKILYTATVVGKDKDYPLYHRSQKVMVSCSCDFFMYYCEFALTRWHAATIKYSNGQPASVTNPSNVPMVCKHLAHLFDVIKDHGF